MFIVCIYGGIASQMNQYSFALALSERFPTAAVKIVIGSSWFKNMDHNGYELDYAFGITADSVDVGLIRRLADFYPGSGVKAKFYNAVNQLRCKLWGHKTSNIQMGDAIAFDRLLNDLDLANDYLFYGNCSREISAMVKSELSERFVFSRPLSGGNFKLARSISGCESVSIHLRRRDYVTMGFTLLGQDYYRRAISVIERKVNNPVYYIFSDDMKCAGEMFDFLQRKVFVCGNTGKNSYIDMQLMSLCKHNITANSGFSFWGAWLNKQPNKIVVIPVCKHLGGAAVTENMGWIQI